MASANSSDINLQQASNPTDRQDVRALWIGIIISAIFTLIIWWAGRSLKSFEASLPEDQGAAWYYWKLPNPTIWTRIFAWGSYIGHQVAIWFLIYFAQTQVKRYSTSLHNVNYWALAVNAYHESI